MDPSLSGHAPRLVCDSVQTDPGSKVMRDVQEQRPLNVSGRLHRGQSEAAEGSEAAAADPEESEPEPAVDEGERPPVSQKRQRSQPSADRPEPGAASSSGGTPSKSQPKQSAQRGTPPSRASEKDPEAPPKRRQLGSLAKLKQAMGDPQ